jgi:hypothetical protein
MTNEAPFMLFQMTSSPRIAPILVDRWFADLGLWIALLGAILGLLLAMVWLPSVLPVPQGDDVRRGRWRVFWGLLLSAVMITSSLLLYTTYFYNFNNRTYPFAVLLADVFISAKCFALILMSTLSFLVVVAVCSRFVGKRPYRYMLIPR